MKQILGGNRLIIAFTLLFIWFVVIAEVVAVLLFADIPGAAWAGLAVPGLIALGLSVAAFVLLRGERPQAGLRLEERAPRSPDVHRVLVIADDTLPAAALRDELASKADGAPIEVLVVAPVLVGPVKHWTDEEDEARAEARGRLAVICSAIEDLGLRARAEIGSDDPLRAIEDALRTFGADEIVLATHPPGQCNWLEKGLVERVRAFYELPVDHIVVQAKATRP